MEVQCGLRDSCNIMTLETGHLISGALFLILVILLLYLDSRKPKGYPPGPKWWPILGSALEIARLRKETGYLFETCTKLSKKYGPVVGLKIGSDRIVILNSFESMRAMYTNEACDGRPFGPVYQVRTMGKRRGVLVTDGLVWSEQRRFVLRHLREFGLGRMSMSTIVEEEAAYLVDHFRKLLQRSGNAKIHNYENNNGQCENGTKTNGQIYQLINARKSCESKGKFEHSKIEDAYVKAEMYDEVVKASSQMAGTVVQMQDAFGVTVLNTLWRMMAGRRFATEDKEMTHLQRILTTLLREIDMIGCPFGHFPILRYIAPELSGYNNFVNKHRPLWKFFESELENHKKTFNATSPRDLMDVYLQVLQSDDPGEIFSESQLLAICVDLFMAGSETTSKALGFCFLYLVLYPEVQLKAQKEIDAVLGRDRFPTLNDRPRMTYVSAMVMESLRMFMGRTLNVPHRALKDTTIMGYSIPKDTMIVVNFNRILMNEFWEDPEKFRPERFINEEGKIAMPEQFLPFSSGRRRCMGEVLAKSNIFIIIAALLQAFTFSPVPGEEKPKDEYTDGVTAGPKPYRVLVSART